MEVDPKFAEKYKEEFVSYIFAQGAIEASLDYAIFNLKLISTLSAGAIALITTVVSRAEDHHELAQHLAVYLPHFILVLFISFFNSLAMYIFGETAVDESHFQINELNKLVAGKPHLSEGPKAKFIERLTTGMLIFHILSGLYFFGICFMLACSLTNFVK